MKTVNQTAALEFNSERHYDNGVIAFIERYPNREDADRNERVFVYKPKGWPEILQPQYDHAPAHILATNGYWSPIHWQHLQHLSYNHPDWRSRLLFTHWRKADLDLNAFCFDVAEQLDPPIPDNLDWQDIDWSPIKASVKEASLLMQHGPMADRLKVAAIHQELKRWLDADDPFYLNQWLPNYRMHGWALDPDDA